jgi:hypothetical protein
MSFQRMNNSNESSYINSFYNEPSFMNKIRREENSKNLNNITNNNEINKNNISNFNIFDKDDKRDEQTLNNKGKDKEISLSKKLEDKKLINEYSNVIEKLLKEEQILFLDDNYHISNSSLCEKIPEDSSNYIISKRVNFPKEIYQ